MNTDERRLLCKTAVLCVSAFICGSLAAQGVNPQSLYGRDTTQSVYVRDSAVAVEKFALAERMEHLKEWDKSADVYMEILRSYADRVVPSQIDAENKIYQYTSVTPAVQERLAKWPEEGLAVFRARYEADAAGLLEAAHDDPAQLHRVFSVYFVTNSALRAGVRLIDIYLERGEFAAAAWLGDRLLTWHPYLNDERPKVLYRTSLAYHLSGNPPQAQARLDELKQSAAQATGEIRGAQVVLADSLAQELAAVPTPQKDVSPDSWPMAFGGPDRARVPQVSGFGGARLAWVEVAKPNIRSVNRQQLRDLEQQNTRDRSMGLMTGILPVVDRGEMFFQDNARIYAVSLETGYPLPGWAETYDGDRNGAYSITGAWPTPRAQQYAVAVTDDSVLAVMGQADFLAMQHTGAFGQRDTRLVCLDRRNGKERWVRQPRNLPDSAANLRNLDLTGSPLVVGNCVYVQARGGKGLQFEDSYVLAFDLASGKFLWSCYVSSANTISPWEGDVGSALSQNVSHLAYSSGRLYALTNLGALAAIDAYDGTIVWLNIYPRDILEQGRNPGFGNWRRVGIAASLPTNKPWSYNPVIVSQGKVFALPIDGLNLHIYDAGTGVEMNRIKLSEFSNARSLLGVVNEKLILGHDRGVVCINWQSYQPPAAPGAGAAARAKAQDAIIWAKNFQKSGMPDDSIRGRAFVTADSVIVPTAWQLVRLSLRNGAVVQAYPPPPAASWGEDEGPGNVLLAQDRMIVAGPTSGGGMRVNVYTDLALAMSKLDAAVAGAPDDPDPRLRYAEIMFVAGKVDLAMQKLDDAMGLILAGGQRTATARDRAFNTALSFAQKLVKENRSGTAELATGLFDRAAAAATTPSQRVHYRTSRAAFARQQNDAAEEIKLYQQILLDPELRAVPYTDSNGDMTPIAAIARKAVDEVIRRAGAEVYSSYEQAAREMLAAALFAGDTARLQGVADSYPNSTSAPKALLAAAMVYETASDPRRATQMLRQVYFGYPITADRALVVEMMARSYLMMPGRIDIAIARLSQGAKQFAGHRLTRPLILPDGSKIENVTFAEALAALRRFGAQSSAADLPDIALPHLLPQNPKNPTRARNPGDFRPAGPESVIPAVASLLVPPPALARHDRVVTFSPGSGIRVFAVGSTEPAFRSDALSQAPRGAAWIGGNLLVWGEVETALLSGEDGKLIWRTSVRSVPQIEVVAQQEQQAAEEPAAPPANPNEMQQEAVIIDGAGRRIMVRDGARVMIGGRMRILNGVVQVQGGQAVQLPARTPTEQVLQVLPLTDRVIVGTTHGRLMALDLENGSVLWQTRLSDRGATHVVASDDFVVIRMPDDAGLSVQLTVFDAFSGQIISRRTWGVNSGVAMVPINLALSPEGRLVFLLPDQICGKDLFEPGGLDRLSFEVPNRGNDGSMPFQNSVLPDQLQISGERVFAMADNNTRVRVYALEDGRQIRYGSATSLDTGAPASGRAIMRVVGSRLYIVSAEKVLGYDMDREEEWTSKLEWRTQVSVRDVIVARDHVLALTEQTGPRGARGRNQPALPMRLKAFSRATTEVGSESGAFEHDIEFPDIPQMLAWQVVDGGIYCLGNDQRLHVRLGVRSEAKAQ